MKRRTTRILTIVGMVAAVSMVPVAAHAETCTDLPGGTTGATLEAGGQEVRIPALSRLQLCSQGGGAIGGLPTVSRDPSGECWESCVSVLLTGSSGGGDGYYALRFYADDQPMQVGVPVPGGGSSPERCLIGVGSPQARGDCEVKLSLDDAPVPVCVNRLCVPPEQVCAGRFCFPGENEIDIQALLDDPCGYLLNGILPQFTCYS